MSKKKGTNPRDWWGIGILLLAIGIGSLFGNLTADDPNDTVVLIGAFGFAIGLFLTIGSAVAHALHAERAEADG